jgi:flagella basal body P-ring formation protein FlgA
MRDLTAGERLTAENVWVKRPGTGEIRAIDYERVLGWRVRRTILKDRQIGWHDIEPADGLVHAAAAAGGRTRPASRKSKAT